MNFGFDKTRFNSIFKPNSSPTTRSNANLNSEALDRPLSDVDNNTKISTRDSLVSKLLDSYNDPSPNTERYNQYLEDQPSEVDYAPSRKRRIGSALLAGALSLDNPERGLRVAREINEAPFRAQLGDWERRGKPLEASARVEQQNIVNKRALLTEAVKNERQQAIDALSSENIHADNTRAEAALTATKAEREANERRYQQSERDRLATEAQRQTDREADNIRQDAAAKITAAAAAEAARHNRASETNAAANAKTAADRAATYANSVKSSSDYRDHLKSKLAASKGDTSASQKVADDLAVHNVILNGANSQIYGNFYDRDDKGRIIVKPPSRHFYTSDDEFNSELADYAQFQKMIADEKASILRNNHPSNSGPPPVTKKPSPVVKREALGG